MTAPASVAATLLHEVAAIVDGPRHATHGPRERSFAMAAALWSAYLGTAVAAADVAEMMNLLKVARARCGDAADPDHYRDQAGYAAIAGELATTSVKGTDQ